MMKMTRPALASLLIGVWLLGHTSTAGDFKQLAAKISDGDRSSIYKAGESGDQRFVPVLRSTIQRFSGTGRPVAAGYIDKENRRSLTSESVSGAARLALARLGDKAEQQKVFCELHSANADIQMYALVVKLNYVGGWFQINGLASLLSPDVRPDFAGGDGTFPEAIHEAVSELNRILPEGPVIKDQQHLAFGGLLTYREDASNWQSWIAEHRGELSRRKPGGTYSYADCPVEGVLRGTISDGSSKPIANAAVRVTWDDAEAGRSERDRLRFNLTTTVQGSFVLAIPPTSYRVCVEETGYFPECKKVSVESSREAILNLRLTLDGNYNRSALQYLLDLKQYQKEGDPEAINRAFLALSHDSSFAQSLVGLLDFQAYDMGERDIQYPAIGTLAVIGSPATPYLIDAIEQNGSELVRTNAAHALALIKLVNGTCVQDLVSILEAAAAPDRTAEEQNRLREAKQYVVHLYPPCSPTIADPSDL